MVILKIKPFHATGSFLYPLKTENPFYIPCFQGVQNEFSDVLIVFIEKETSGMKCVKK